MKNNASIFIYVLFVVSLQSTGYDLYAHSLFYYYNSEQIPFSYAIFNNQVIIPRYGLLSMIYEGTRQFGIPTGWVAVVLSYKPLKDILSHLDWLSGLRYKRLIVITICTVPIYFYSGLSLVALWIMAASVTGRSFYMLAAAFHPVGAVLGVLGTVIGGNNKFKILWLIVGYVLLLSLSYFNSSIFTLFPSISVSNIKQNIVFEDLVSMIYLSYELKQNEINAVLLMMLMSFTVRSQISNLVKYIRALFQMTAQLLWVPVLVTALSFNALTRDINSLAKALVTLNISKSIYITWFDAGVRDEKFGFWRANATRHNP